MCRVQFRGAESSSGEIYGAHVGQGVFRVSFVGFRAFALHGLEQVQMQLRGLLSHAAWCVWYFL